LGKLAEGVNEVEKLNDLAHLIRLQSADEVPDDIVRKHFHLWNRFLESTFAKVSLPSTVGIPNQFNRLHFAHRNQIHFFRASSALSTGLPDLLMNSR
jgi:hypothetical protein